MKILSSTFDDLSTDRKHSTLLGLVHVLLESRGDKLIGEKVHALRIHEMLFAVEMKDELNATNNKIHSLLGLAHVLNLKTSEDQLSRVLIAVASAFYFPDIKIYNRSMSLQRAFCQLKDHVIFLFP